MDSREIRLNTERLASVREDLELLRKRLARGELAREEYQLLRSEVLADLTAEERGVLSAGTPTPLPTAPGTGTPRPVTPSGLGPSGGSGRGLRTSIPSLADLDLQPGSILLGQWKLVRELGRGGFGAVFEAEELHLGERQAVKVLDPAMVAKEELLARFRREVSLMRRLEHPRIVRVFDYREDLTQLVALISMQLVTGGSVKQLLAAARARRVEIPVPLALEILGQTLEALAEAHSQGVIHRDVTPGNVLLAGGAPEELLAQPGRDPQVKLVDFGIAGLVERSELSQKSRVLGTAAYVAPEVLDPAVEVTPVADVYGAGALAYELLTGQLPVGRFEAVAELRRAFPAELDRFVMSLVARRPENRPSAEAGESELRMLCKESVPAALRAAEGPGGDSEGPASAGATERNRKAGREARQGAEQRALRGAMRDAGGGEVQAQIRGDGRPPAAPTGRGKDQGSRRSDPPWLTWAGLAVGLLVVAIAMGWGLSARRDDQARLPAGPEGAGAAEPAPIESENQKRSQPVASSVREEAPKVVQPTRAASPHDDPTFQLDLEFSEDCWVEYVVDGVRRTSELRTSGETLRLTARQEILLTIGNTRAVRAELDGRPLDLPAGAARVLRDFRITRESVEQSGARLRADPFPSRNTLAPEGARAPLTLQSKATGAYSTQVLAAIEGEATFAVRFRLMGTGPAECVFTVALAKPARSSSAAAAFVACRLGGQARLSCAGAAPAAIELSEAAAHADFDQACRLAADKLGGSLLQFLLASSRGGNS